MSKRTPSVRKGPHRDPAKERFWRGILKQFAASGLDIRAFCRRRGLTEPSFYAWRREIARRDGKVDHRPGRHIQPRGDKRLNRRSSLAFTKMLIRAEPIVPESNLCLRLAGGRELILPMSMPAGQLAAIIRALDGASV